MGANARYAHKGNQNSSTTNVNGIAKVMAKIMRKTILAPVVL